MPWGTGAYDPYTVIQISLLSASIYRLIVISSIFYGSPILSGEKANK
jgi:hypothetical protein